MKWIAQEGRDKSQKYESGPRKIPWSCRDFAYIFPCAGLTSQYNVSAVSVICNAEKMNKPQVNCKEKKKR